MLIIDVLRGVLASSNSVVMIAGFITSSLIAIALVSTTSLHGFMSTDFTDGIQKFHRAPTPRIGGIAIYFGAVCAWVVATQELRESLGIILLAGLPAFLFGLLEDVTRKVGVAQRLLATMASGVFAWWLTGYSLSRVDVWGVDWMMQWTLVSVLFTAFAVGGVANSVNIIDGFNGLSSSMSFWAFLSYGMIAWQVGDNVLSQTCLVLSACVVGFFILNWPFGKIFLGDGGAYFVGFALAWVAILLLERHHEVSTFGALIVCCYPVTEVLFSVYRRRLKGAHPGQPDRLHLHSLFMQRYVRRWLGGLSLVMRNSVVGLVMGSLTIVSGVVANLVFENEVLSIVMLLGFVLGYVFMFRYIVRFGRLV